MAAERIIGVDFGTSTSVIRVKRYQDGKPIGDRLGTDKVTFNMGSTMVPTLIQKLPSGDAYFGYDAEIARRKTETFQNFKVDFENPDEGIRRQARELTAEYFTYLAKSYRTQSEGGHLGERDDKERTIISYPVKWSNETKAFMVRTAQDAGFPNVEGIDEAQAAIQAVTIQNADLLTRKGYFRDGIPVNILLIDMGAGTTDLVLCRHAPGQSPKTDILRTWPQGGNAFFGGREVDELLKSYICQAMPEEDADAVLRKIGLEKYKAWKEGMVSPALKKRETVDSFAALDDLLDVLESEAEYSIDRDSFETHAADYLRQFPELVNGCVSAAGLSRDDVNLVILTGGHSQWYFVREMLSGKLDRFGKIGLRKIQTDPERVIPISLPQETVALGLVYGPLNVEVSAEPEPEPVEEDKKRLYKLKESTHEIISSRTISDSAPKTSHNLMDEFLEDVKLELIEIKKHFSQIKHEGKISFNLFKSVVGGFKDEEVLYVRQDWISPKYGFVITNRGFHSCGSGFFDSKVFVSWKQFLSCSRIEKAKKGGYIYGIHESEWETASYQVGYEAPKRTGGIVPAFTHLLNSLQKKYTVDAQMNIVKK